MKNLVLFPLEAGLITLLLQLLVPHMAAMSLVPKGCVPTGTGRKKMLLQILLTFLISVAVVLLYIFVLQAPLAAHNIKLF